MPMYPAIVLVGDRELRFAEDSENNCKHTTKAQSSPFAQCNDLIFAMTFLHWLGNRTVTSDAFTGEAPQLL
jgi:hypothetical protein